MARAPNVAIQIQATILMINTNVLRGLKQEANTLHLEGRLQKSELRKNLLKRKQKPSRHIRLQERKRKTNMYVVSHL